MLVNETLFYQWRYKTGTPSRQCYSLQHQDPTIKWVAVNWLKWVWTRVATRDDHRRHWWYRITYERRWEVHNRDYKHGGKLFFKLRGCTVAPHSVNPCIEQIGFRLWPHHIYIFVFMHMLTSWYGSALLRLCVGNPPETGRFPSTRARNANLLYFLDR